ncbi:MAG: hypothetical protein ABI806_25340 [Candidatus Solibacter sp.]
MKISRTGLLCLIFVSVQALASAQAPQDAADQTPAQQPPAQQAPAQQQPPPPTPPPTQPQPQPQDQQPPDQQPESRRLKLPPAPPKVTDVRMPGEAGWFIGLTGWLPTGSIYMEKGTDVSFTASSRLKMQGRSKNSFGLDFGVAAGLHNSLRFSYFYSKKSGSTILANDIVAFSQPYSKGDEVSTNTVLSNYKISYEYLTWPYPVEARHFRLKTLYQVQYVVMKGVFDAPIKSATPDVNGTLTDYSTRGTKSLITPALGLGVHQYATRNFRFEANASGFGLPGHWYLIDADAVIAYRVAKIEVRAGGKALVFRTTTGSDYFYRGAQAGLFVGVRWYSD